MAIITISRGTFSGGQALAEELVKKFGYPSISREDVLKKATKEYGISEEDLSSVVNKPPPFWVQVPAKRIAFLKCFTAVLLEQIRDGNLIYHGHAGHLLLTDIPNVMRIRLVADMVYRVKAAKELYKLEGEAAEAYIEKKDRDRRKWARFFYGIELDDPLLYDAVFNLERMGIENVSELISKMIEFDKFKASKASSKKLDDFMLATRVWASLAKDKRTRGASINVTANKGVVAITGNVALEKTVEAVSEVSRQVKGVVEVKNEIGVGGDLYW
jgi:cytidylate kinase